MFQQLVVLTLFTSDYALAYPVARIRYSLLLLTDVEDAVTIGTSVALVAMTALEVLNATSEVEVAGRSAAGCAIVCGNALSVSGLTPNGSSEIGLAMLVNYMKEENEHW